METGEITIEHGSGNVFADLERPDAEAHLLKAELVTHIDKIIRRRGLKQIEAARSWDCRNPMCRVSCGATSASIRSSASCAC